MNSLSIISSTVEKVIGSTPPSTPQPEPFVGLRRTLRAEDFELASDERKREHSAYDGSRGRKKDESAIIDESEDDQRLHSKSRKRGPTTLGERIYLVILSPWIGAIKWIISTVASSAIWLTSSIYDDDGAFSPARPLRRMMGLRVRYRRRDGRPPNVVLQPHIQLLSEDSSDLPASSSEHRRSRSFGADIGMLGIDEGGIAPRRSIRIRLYNEEKLQKNKSSFVKSPTSPSASLRLTKYPRVAGPPMPLLPTHPAPKTLILDLDETLIHSLAKGGRMSSGHMVEVKLDKQHAILYYVHKRPYCDEFLRKVCRWYNLVIFTASVQEYADPVIDWLEQDRKYFSGRYYRQHCTNRNGAYIKDIATVEPDLSKVMILDNSPMSYIFHEDNAIPIEGWINDPTDLDLLHLIPMLQAMQYVADVRALLALRMGESFA